MDRKCSECWSCLRAPLTEGGPVQTFNLSWRAAQTGGQAPATLPTCRAGPWCLVYNLPKVGNQLKRCDCFAFYYGSEEAQPLDPRIAGDDAHYPQWECLLVITITLRPAAAAAAWGKN